LDGGAGPRWSVAAVLGHATVEEAFEPLLLQVAARQHVDQRLGHAAQRLAVVGREFG
jgi:hypothetical protein